MQFIFIIFVLIVGFSLVSSFVSWLANVFVVIAPITAILYAIFYIALFIAYLNDNK